MFLHGALNRNLQMLVKLQKRFAMAIDNKPAAFLEPMVQHKNLTSLSLVFSKVMTLKDVHHNWLT